MRTEQGQAGPLSLLSMKGRVKGKQRTGVEGGV